MIKKYNEFYGTSLEPTPIFEQFIFQKQVCNHVIIGGREVRVFGSLWKFIFSYLSNEKQKILQFGLDAGFGELNSLGIWVYKLAETVMRNVVEPSIDP